MRLPSRVAVAIAIACGVVGFCAAVACSTFDTASPADGDVADAVSPDGGSVDAGSVSPCVGAEHLFCADFNENPFNRGWDDQYFNNDASTTLALDKSRSVSPPSSLHAHLDDSAFAVEASLIEKIRFAPMSVDVSLSLRVNMPTTGSSSPLSFVVGQTGAGEALFVVMQQRGNNVELSLTEVHHVDGGDTLTSHPSAKPIPIENPTQWHRLRVTAVATSTVPLRGDLTLYVDGVMGVTTNATFEAPSGSPGLLVQVGIRHFDDNYPVQDVNIDDVIIDATP